MKICKTILYRFIIVGIMALFMCACASTQSTKVDLKPLTSFEFGQRHIVAVIPFKYKAEQEQYKNLSNKLVDLTLDELLESKRFRAIERSRIDAVLKEIQLSQTGIIDEKAANRIGKQLGAEMILVGNLISIKPTMSRDSMGIMWQETRGFEISLQGRIINVETGEIMASAKATGMEGQQEKMALGAKTGVIAAEETLINKAAETAIRILVNDLSSQISPKPDL
ncbi:MAG: CsgG/HfaB family protein [Proteobacteria bacterium]|nr:CsgG/HfaB family protein [Pseudomonadota bacterium]